MRRFWFGLAIYSVMALPVQAQQPAFSLPLDCATAPSCFLQNYVDLDPGPERRDPFCGEATFNGHKGTDIRVRNITELENGISVLAMADGTVLRTRDGMADRMTETKAHREAVKGQECGNGLVIDHGDGWTSQICHLKKGSVTVRRGDKVKRGTAIAQMGLSGDTAFPHVHVTIRQGKTIIDPMSGKQVGYRLQRRSPAKRFGRLRLPKYFLRKIRHSSTRVLQAGRSTGCNCAKVRSRSPIRAGLLSSMRCSKTCSKATAFQSTSTNAAPVHRSPVTQQNRLTGPRRPTPLTPAAARRDMNRTPMSRQWL